VSRPSLLLLLLLAEYCCGAGTLQLWQVAAHRRVDRQA